MRDLSDDLLAWYDVHAREMPWRVMPADRKAGVLPNPYHVWMSEVMLQQTTVATVRAYHQKFTVLWPTIQDLAAAKDADVMAAWAGLGYYARARNLLKCARAVTQDYGGVFPSDHAELLTLPGIGPYTASAIASIAFNQHETVLDGNVERVMSRMYNVHTPLPAAKPELMALAKAITPSDRPGDYNQAVMDLGATICTPRNPACGICPWREPCLARTNATAAELPKKTPKKAKPTRRGFAYVVRRADGAWLLETRPEKGLLGGMLGWPTSDWSDNPTQAPPIDADWTTLNDEALHTFTHFHLILKVLIARTDLETEPKVGDFIQSASYAPSALPTVMRKVYDLAEATFRHD